MAKLTLNSITSRYGSVDALNDNFSSIEDAIENTLSRDGTSPNYMESDLDMNSNSILNANAIYGSAIYLNGQALEIASPTSAATVQVFEYIATEGQTTFSISPLEPSSANVIVDVNGILYPTSSISTSGTNVILPALTAGDEVSIRVYTRDIGAYATASELTYTSTYGGTTRTVQARLDDTVSVKNFGAIGDGVADDTLAIQAACDSGKVIYFPQGTYKVTATIIVNINGTRLVGSGMYSTIIQRTTDYGDTFFFTGNDSTGVQLLNTGISHMTIRSDGATTSGAHLHFNGLQRMEATDLYLLHGFISMKCMGVAAGHIARIYSVIANIYGVTSNVGRRNLVCGQTPSTLYPRRVCGDLFFTDTNWRGNVNNTRVEYAVHITCGDGIWFNNGHCGNATIANINLSNECSDPDGMLTLIFFNNFMSDEPAAAIGIRFAGNTNAVSEQIRFTNCDVRAGVDSTYGIVTTASAQFYSVQFTGCAIYGNQIHGVFIQSPDFRGISFTGCRVYGNSLATANGADGYFLAASTRDISIVGGSSGGNTFTGGGTLSQRYGIAAGGITGPLVVSGVDLTGNLTGPVVVPAEGAVVSGCIDSDSYRSIVAAATLTIPELEDLVAVSGTTTITNIVVARAGRKVTLLFSNTAQVTDGGNIVLASNFTGGAGRTLSLACDGTNWYETSRSVN